MRDRIFYAFLVILLGVLLVQAVSTYVLTEQGKTLKTFATEICSDSNVGRNAGNEARIIQRDFMLNAAEAREREAARHQAAGDIVAARQNLQTAADYRADAKKLDIAPLTKCQVN